MSSESKAINSTTKRGEVHLATTSTLSGGQVINHYYDDDGRTTFYRQDPLDFKST